MLYDWTITPPGGSPYDASDLASIAIPASDVGTYSLAVSVLDGNYGGTAAATGSVKSSAPAATQPPTIEAPLSAMLNVGDTIQFGGTSAISVVAPALADVLVSLEVNHGTLSVGSTAGVSEASEPANDGQGWELSLAGSEQAVDAALTTLGYSSTSGEDDTLNINATAYGANGAYLSALVYGVVLQAPADPTIATLNSATLSADGSVTFSGPTAITVGDIDQTNGPNPNPAGVEIEFVPTGGTLSVPNIGLAGHTGLSLYGSIADVNAAINGMVFTATGSGPASLGMELVDSAIYLQHSHSEQLTLPINPPATTDTGDSEVLSASIATSGDLTQGSTVSATANVTGTSANSALTYVWTVTAPDGSQVSVGDEDTITFTASEQGTYSILASVLDTTYNVGTAVTTEADITSSGGGGGGGGGDDDLENIGSVQLPTITEDCGTNNSNNPGEQIEYFVDESDNSIADLNSSVSDPGIAVTYVDTSDGSWQYSLDGGTTWDNVPDVSATSALLLDSTDSIRFVPNAGYFGTLSEAFDFVAWDGLNGTTGSTVDTTGETDDSIYYDVSSDSSYATLYVQPIVSITASGDQFTVSTDAPVPNDLVVEISASGTTSSTVPGTGFNCYLTSNFTVFNQSGGVSTSAGLGSIWVDIPTGQQQATVTVNSGPFSTGGTVMAAVEYAAIPSNGGWSATLDSFAPVPGQQASVTLAPTSPSWLSANSAGGSVAWSFDGASNDGVDAGAVVVNTDPAYYGGSSTSLSWYTVDGTALAGTDYTSTSGTIDFAGGSSSTSTVSIPLFHTVNGGGKLFYIVSQWSGPDGTKVGVEIVGFANPELQMYGDSNGDGYLTLNDDDPPSNPSLASSTPITVPVVQTDSGAASSAFGYGTSDSVSSNDLIQVWVDAYDGPNATLTLTATGSGTIQAWQNPNETDPVDLEAGATFTAGQFPNWLWINGEDVGNVQINAELDLDNAVVQAPQVAQQIGAALLSINAVQAATTTVAIGHSNWAYTTAAGAGEPTNSARTAPGNSSVALKDSQIVAACGCGPFGLGTKTVQSPMKKLESGGPSWVQYSTPSILPALPWNVWPPSDPNLPVNWHQLYNLQENYDKSPSPNDLIGYVLPKPGTTYLASVLSPSVNGQPEMWPALPPASDPNLKADFLAVETARYTVVMRAWTAAIVQDAIKRMVSQSVSSWTVKFTFDPSPSNPITAAAFMNTTFGNGIVNGKPINIGLGLSASFAINANSVVLQITSNGPPYQLQAVTPIPAIPWVGTP